MIALDVVFLAMLLVLFPLQSYRGFPSVMRAIVDGGPGVRASRYRQAMLGQWVLCAAGIAVWIAGGRDLAALGFRVPHGAGFWAALALSATAAGALHAQLRAAARSDDLRGELRTRLGGALVILPRASGEAVPYALLCLTAGVCEEILYRGWLLGWLAPRIGMPAAFALAVVAFGVAHSYAGSAVAWRAGATGLALAALFVLSGSLWVPIALHVAIDLNAGGLSLAAHRDARTGEVAA